MLRPEMSPALRAAIMPPPGFQSAPVMQAWQDAQTLQELHLQEQSARIHALEASVRHQQQTIDALNSQLSGAMSHITRLKSFMQPAEKIDADVVTNVTIDGDDYVCGFLIDGDDNRTASLECTAIWAIGAVNISQYAPDYLTNACVHAVEKERDERYQKTGEY